MDVWKDYLKSLNTGTASQLIKNNKYTFDGKGLIGSTDKNDYGFDGKLKSPSKLYGDFKKRDETIDALQTSLNMLKIRDYENKPLKVDKVFGPRTQSAWNKFARENLPEEKNELAGVAEKTSIAADIIKGTVPSMTVVSPLQTKVTRVIADTNSDGKHFLRYPKDQRQFMIDQHFDRQGNPTSPPHINVEAPNNPTKLQTTVAKKLNHIEIPKPIYEAFHNFDEVKTVVKTGGKALAVTGAALDAYELGTTIYSDLNDEDKKLGKKTAIAAAGIGGSWAGAFAGAKAGAMGGAAVGTLIGAFGTVIGGFLGGIGGGIAGALGGRALGEHIVDKTYQGE